MNGDEHYAAIRRACADRGIDWPQCGFSVGPGWLPIVLRALDEMIAAGWDRQLLQVKQKFCQLRLYIGQASSDVRDAVERAEADCNRSCEECGARHFIETPCLGRALCSGCREPEKED